MTRRNFSSGAKWEPVAGYSRAVRVGPHIWIAGTTSTDADGAIVGVGDVHQQTLHTLANIERALTQAGASLSDVVRTRMFVVNIDDWEVVAHAHGAVFGEIRPASTMVEVSGLIAPEILVEIEADAYVDSETMN